MSWYSFLFSFETVGILCLIIIAIYFTWITRHKRKGKPLVMSWDQDFDMPPLPQISLRKPGYQGRGQGKHEEKCREIFQRLFDAPFPTVRPNFLRNPATGRNLELDGFNEFIPTPCGKGLAFEYDGGQHSSYNSHFHNGNPEEFVYTAKKDILKDKLCKQQGILLIRIPHFVQFEDLERYIKSRLEEEGLKL